MLADATGGTGSVGSPFAWILIVLLAVGLAVCVMLLRRRRHEAALIRHQHDQAMLEVQARRNELEATLSSMLDGVLTVDPEQHLMSLNAAAGRLLGVEPDQVVGRSVEEVITSDPLRQFIVDALAADEPIKRDIALATGEMSGAAFQAQATVLTDRNDERIGSLIALHDVTQLRRLEVMRRDFVANVSHEIKTPVTAIKAAAETLLDSDEHDPDIYHQFLSVIIRQADRLQAILEDLLSLARIEQESEQQRLVVEPVRVATVLARAVETCGARAQARKATIEVACPDYVVIPVNASLLEQAVVNLIDNAIKYGPEGGRIRVVGQRIGEHVVVSVQDFGQGIAAEHLPRIFERFYRTDRARSRELGGTGLGLAIVKHIAQAHGGRVSVESKPGQGSTFRIHLSTY
ncbi:MAG: PAS domain-containing protein [Planctomycetes bacterium]|nr:PAS domain-containing protein [Planctomycetota bacterium]